MNNQTAVSYAIQRLFKTNSQLTYKVYTLDASCDLMPNINRTMYYRLKRVIKMTINAFPKLSLIDVQTFLQKHESSQEYAPIIFETAYRLLDKPKPEEPKKKKPNSTILQLEKRIVVLEKEIALFDEIGTYKDNEINHLNTKIQALETDNHFFELKIHDLEARNDELAQALAEREADIAHWQEAYGEIEKLLRSFESKGLWQTMVGWFKK